MLVGMVAGILRVLCFSGCHSMCPRLRLRSQFQISSVYFGSRVSFVLFSRASSAFSPDFFTLFDASSADFLSAFPSSAAFRVFSSWESQPAIPRQKVAAMRDERRTVFIWSRAPCSELVFGCRRTSCAEPVAAVIFEKLPSPRGGALSAALPTVPISSFAEEPACGRLSVVKFFEPATDELRLLLTRFSRGFRTCVTLHSRGGYLSSSA